ncbi:MAG TPA: hypothetical protein VHK47_13270 [Polyangia bacterium]|nr:hypothetical protein [Polyangia bacterium]
MPPSPARKGVPTSRSSAIDRFKQVDGTSAEVLKCVACACPPVERSPRREPGGSDHDL